MKYEQVGWIFFLNKFNGFQDEVSWVFTQNFDGKTVNLGSFRMVVDKEPIIEATRLSQSGEKYFKGMLFN